MGLTHLEQPVQLASGEWSRDFIDAKVALAKGENLALACRAILELASEREIAFDAVGGMTMGADQFAHGIAVLSGSSWFVVRKTPKGRGTNKRVEGRVLQEGDRLLVEDVVTTGGSIFDAYTVISTETGATVAAVVTLVDRGETAKELFSSRQVPYFPLLTYVDLGIDPVGPGLVRS